VKHCVAKLLPLFLLAFSLSAAANTRPLPTADVRRAVDAAIQPLMQQYAVPGMAVGVIVGRSSYVFNYGLASLNPPRLVTSNTLFEIGSVTKTFTATLASYAQVTGHLSLSDRTSQFFPSLRGSPFGRVTLLELGTHTAGGLPLQVPENIQTDDQLLRYFRAWRPTCAPATCRTYSNISIGTLGLIAAKSMDDSFGELMQRAIFSPLGMTSTYLTVPPSRLSHYAEGYTSNGRPIRMDSRELSEEAYGIRTTAADLLLFLQANMNPVSTPLGRAIAATHTGYFHAGPITQDLIWEQFPWPVSLPRLLQGNSPAMIFNPMPATAVTPPEKPSDAVWLNKTGSTNGFGAYVVLIPSRHVAIVMLANKSYPLSARVTAAYRIVTALSRQVP
jgi:beta-lactamase class C